VVIKVSGRHVKQARVSSVFKAGRKTEAERARSDQDKGPMTPAALL